MLWLVNWRDIFLIIILIIIIYLVVFSFRPSLGLKFEMSRYLSFLFFVILFFGCFSRIYELGERSLWLDELRSLRDSQSLQYVTEVGHPPLFFIILHFFRYIGENEFFLRLPSAIFGIFTILLIYKVGKLFFGTIEGLISAFLLSISIFHIHYSQEARMYALFAFLSLLSLFFFYKVLKENKRRLWLGFVFSTVLNLYTHYFAFFVVVVEIIFFVIKQILENKRGTPTKRTSLMFILSAIIIFLLYLPWLLNKPLLFSPDVAVKSAVKWLKEEPQLSLFTILFSEFGAGGGIALYTYLFFFIIGAITCIKEAKGILLLLWTGFPTASVFLISIYVKPIISTGTLRYVIFILPIYLLLISRGISLSMEKIQSVKKCKKVTLSVILSVVILFSFLSITHLQERYASEKEWRVDWSAVAQFFEDNSRNKDIITIAGSRTLMSCLLYYYDNIRNQEVILSRIYNNSTIDYYTLSNNITIVSTSDLNTLQDICSKNNRVWIVSSQPGFSTPPAIKNWLDDNLTLVEEFPGRTQIYLKQPVSFDAAVFAHVEWESIYFPWEKILGLMGASVTTFSDATVISDVNFSEFDIVVFADFRRPLDDKERLHLKESVENGGAVVISGLSPYSLEAATGGGAGKVVYLTKISSWFGATMFSEASRGDKWNVKFTENAIEIMKQLDLEREYAFYTYPPDPGADWSTPTGCIAQPTSLVYAYRVNDGAATIFTHKFGKGVSIFIGPRFGFDSPDAETFKTLVKSLIRFHLGG